VGGTEELKKELIFFLFYLKRKCVYFTKYITFAKEFPRYLGTCPLEDTWKEAAGLATFSIFINKSKCYT